MAGGSQIRVAIGRAGILANKREGDGGTPRGRFRLVRLWWRADRAPRPRTLLPVRRIGKHDGWSEDPKDRLYNRPIRVADGVPGDRLWRQDGLYDFIIELDHNTRPRVAGRGSAVFIHVAREGIPIDRRLRGAARAAAAKIAGTDRAEDQDRDRVITPLGSRSLWSICSSARVK